VWENLGDRLGEQSDCEMSEAIQVGVRVRPLSDRELRKSEYFAWRIIPLLSNVKQLFMCLRVKLM
jgi:hypothetical protein